MESDIERDAGALAWAHALKLGNCLYGELAKGDHFRFAASPPGERLVKLASGYRNANGGPMFKTGARSAVYRVES
jgi:hypothetical protein